MALKPTVSVHGQALLLELANVTTAVEHRSTILDYISKDPLCGKLKSRELGNTAYHYLMDPLLPDTFVLDVLRALLTHCPSGILIKNNAGAYPIHYALQRHGEISRELVRELLRAHPASVHPGISAAGADSAATAPAAAATATAGVGVGMGMGMGVCVGPPLVISPATDAGDTSPPPFHLYLQRNRDIVDLDICQTILALNAGAAARCKDANGNYALHLACSKSPFVQFAGAYTASHANNLELIHMLVQIYPEACKAYNTSHLAYPLHLLCSNTTHLATITEVYNAYPDAVQVCDKQGKSCLHHATTAVGKCNQRAVSSEEAERCRLQDLQLSMKNKSKGRRGGDKEASEALKMALNSTAGTGTGAGAGASKGKGKDSKGGGGGGGGGGGKGRDEYDYEDEDGEDDYGDEYGDDDNVDGSDKAGGGDSSSAAADSAAGAAAISNRQAIRFIANMHPDAFLYLDRATHTPVESVLNGAKPVIGAKSSTATHKSLTLIESDDPQTARLLLLLHQKCAAAKACGELKPRYLRPLTDLNWQARRDAFLISLECVYRPFTTGCTVSSSGKGKWSAAVSAATAVAAGLAQKEGSAVKSKATKTTKGAAGGGAKSAKNSKDSSSGGKAGPDVDADGVAVVPGTPTKRLSTPNILASIRQRGPIDCIRLIIGYL